MRLNTRHLALIAVATSMAVPTGAMARTIDAAGGRPSPNIPRTTCSTDYSKNSATGEYCVDPATGLAPVTSQPSAPATRVVVKDAGFSWADAGTGAGAIVGLLVVSAGGASLVRRRRESGTLAPAGSSSDVFQGSL
jgi:hypothetical protein